MAGTYPSTPSFQSVDFQIIAPTFTTESFSGKIRRVGQGHQYYAFTANYPSLTPSDFMPVRAFLARQYGQVESFQIVLPDISTSKAANKAAIGTPVTTSALSAGTKTCTISGMTADTAQVIKAGDFFKFNGHSKVYMAVDDLDSDASGEGTLTFAGGLVETVASGEGITVDGVAFTVILDNDLQEFAVGIGGMTTYNVGLREVW